MHNLLKQTRKSSGVKAEEMQSLLGLQTVGAYYKKERDEVAITVYEALQMAKKLGKSVEDIFFA